MLLSNHIDNLSTQNNGHYTSGSRSFEVTIFGIIGPIFAVGSGYLFLMQLFRVIP